MTFDLLVVRWKHQQNTECVLSGQRQDVTLGTWTSGGEICLTNSLKQRKTSLQRDELYCDAETNPGGFLKGDYLENFVTAQ